MSASVAIPAAPLRQDAQVISLVGLAHGVSHFFHLILAPLFPWLKVEFGLSYAELGMLMSVFFIVSGTVQALAGFVVDHFGPRPVLFAGLGFLGLSALMLGFSASYAGLVFGAALAGLGNGVFHPADFTLLNRRVSPQRLGHAFSVHGIAGNLGWAAAPVFLVGLANLDGWRSAVFGASAVAFAVLAILTRSRAALDTSEVRPTVAADKEATPGDSSREGRLAFLKLPQVWMCWGFFFLTTIALAGIQSFAPTALTQLYAMSLPMATTAYTVYMLCSAAGMLVGGFAAARAQQHDRVIALCFLLSGSMAVLVASAWLPAMLIPALLGLMGFGAGIAGPSRDLLVRAAAPKGATGRVYGAVYSGLDIGFAIGPVIFGALMDARRPGALFLVVGAFQVLAILTAVTVGQGNRQRRVAAI